LQTKFPRGTRVRTPAGRFARVTKMGVTSDGRIHLVYYDGDESEVSFPVSLLSEDDIIKAPYTFVAPESDRPSDIEVKTFWGGKR
jgi:hypothetical protein